MICNEELPSLKIVLNISFRQFLTFLETFLTFFLNFLGVIAAFRDSIHLDLLYKYSTNTCIIDTSICIIFVPLHFLPNYHLLE